MFDTCRICTSIVGQWAVHTLLGKYRVQYYRCPRCGTVQTESPWWLDEAYVLPLAATDVGAVSRSIALARVVAATRALVIPERGPCLDVGGGYGLLVRLLRDAGIDCYWEDRYAPNLYARGFEAPADAHYALVTALEVLEHLVDPLEQLARWLERSDSVLVTTTLLPTSAPAPGEWWYYAPEAGQHVTIYTLAALRVAAERLRVHLATDGARTHLFTRSAVSPLLFRLACDGRANRLVALLRRHRSLLAEDYRLLAGRDLEGESPAHDPPNHPECRPCG